MCRHGYLTAAGINVLWYIIMCEYQISLKIFSFLVIFLKILGTAMHLAATATPNWLKDANVTFGFFQACTGTDCSDFSDFLSNAGKLDISGEIRASQILALFAVIISFGTLFLSVAEVMLDHVAKHFYKVRIVVPIFSLTLAILSFLFIVVCAAMMGAAHLSNGNSTITTMKLEDLQESFDDFQVGSSLILSVCGGVLIALGGLLSAIREKRSRAFKKRHSTNRMAKEDESTGPTYAEQGVSGMVDVSTSGQNGEATIHEKGQISKTDKNKFKKCQKSDNSAVQIDSQETKPDRPIDASAVNEEETGF